MAEEYLRKYAGDLVEVESAGLEPGSLNPIVVDLLAEDGIDISGKATQSVDDLYRAGNTYTYVIAVCSKEAQEKCPIFPGRVIRQHWPFPDPSAVTGSDAERFARIREIRDDIKDKVREFADELRKQTGELAP
jgi:arsenate reductase